MVSILSEAVDEMPIQPNPTNHSCTTLWGPLNYGENNDLELLDQNRKTLTCGIAIDGEIFFQHHILH